MILLIGIFTVGIAFTYSRATYLAYGTSALFAVGYLLQRKKKELSYILLGSIILLVLLIPFLPRPDGEGVKLERTSTIVSRTTSAQSDLSQLKGLSWMTGQGLFTNSNNQLLTQNSGHNHVPDNWLIMMLSGTGVVGTVLFILILGKFAWQNKKKNPFFVIALSAVLVHGFFNASMIYIFVLLWLGVLYVRNYGEK